MPDQWRDSPDISACPALVSDRRVRSVSVGNAKILGNPFNEIRLT
jgi:hypothetical protein